AGGIAHDFNNMLGVILGHTELLLAEPDLNRSFRADLADIRDAATRSADLVRQLLAFSRKQVLQPKVLNLNETVSGTTKMLRRLIGEDVELKTSLDPVLRPVKADPGQIEQVLLNLATNARDAMPRGGRLTISTTNTALRRGRRPQGDGLPAGQYVVVTVSDSGGGMDAATQERIFEPFFTTKEQGKGTGLGLATVYGIIKQSGGHVAVESQLGHGTTFRIYLPAIEQAAALGSEQTECNRLIRGLENILLVEDEPGLRHLIQHVLERAGYTVLAAGNGAEALERAGRHVDRIHLAIVDVVMPGLNGCELAESLRQQYPGMRALYMSGYSDDILSRHGALAEDVALLPKPFTPAALTRRIREVLDAA
ncbi:MAG: response regulator, partial [Chloroflexi bacterium]|nr:response regulator [Chloroflexota bacterium]